jgi:hypothetical protein
VQLIVDFRSQVISVKHGIIQMKKHERNGIRFIKNLRIC